MKKAIRYDLIGSFRRGVEIHPQVDVKNLGMKVHDFHGAPIGDCVFILVSNIPLELPNYIDIVDYKF